MYVCIIKFDAFCKFYKYVQRADTSRLQVSCFMPGGQPKSYLEEDYVY